MNKRINHAERNRRQEVLKRIIKDLHNGVPVSKLQKTFARLVKDTSPEEIADMENALIDEGFPPEEIQRLCDVHVQVFEKSLARVGKPSKIPGHPIHTYIEENREAVRQLKKLGHLIKLLRKGKKQPGLQGELETEWRRFKEIEKHYQRKENQLFPTLEAVQFTGPAQVMWGKHDEIRHLIKVFDQYLKAADWNSCFKTFKDLESSIKKMIFLEEKILYPTSVRKLSELDWAKMKQGESAIGYAWVTPAGVYDAKITKMLGKNPSDTTRRTNKKEASVMENQLSLSQGQLTIEQINLMLKNLPVDITYVDENDTVRYYSDTKERIFPRSPAIVGRKVQNCHPSKSVHVVNDIIQSFKEKKKEVAEFWIQKDGLFIHIRYFPIYDESGSYRGVIEVSQEVSSIRSLEGERRILDW